MMLAFAKLIMSTKYDINIFDDVLYFYLDYKRK